VVKKPLKKRKMLGENIDFLIQYLFHKIVNYEDVFGSFNDL